MQQFVPDVESADGDHNGRRDGREGADGDKADQHGPEEQDEGAPRLRRGARIALGVCFAVEACTFSTDSECLVLESRGFAVAQSGRYRIGVAVTYAIRKRRAAATGYFGAWKEMITGFALPTSAARSPAGTLADPTARGRRLNVRDVRDIRACPDRPGSDHLVYWVISAPAICFASLK
jgi:hypothetical protein